MFKKVLTRDSSILVIETSHPRLLLIRVPVRLGLGAKVMKETRDCVTRLEMRKWHRIYCLIMLDKNKR